MSGVYAFGPEDRPIYAAHVGQCAPRDGAPDSIGGGPVWCHPFGKGHRTVRAAAQHAARLFAAQWDAVPSQEEGERP